MAPTQSSARSCPVTFWVRQCAVANFKDGSAKTTRALYLSQSLALAGFRVLAIDLDPQASLSAMLGINPSSTSRRTKLSTAPFDTTNTGGQCGKLSNRLILTG
ncbi:AAA family ATPase [Bradyrhizobium sp. WBAH42]|uniref:AAA family ATPase n=1 Tax=Bradyrhizobium sp. WBAH42 TaxID=1390132 RepID=UPI00211F1100|nr:AAA family ATPase [Bradyrhizobium sp. WBAH42]